MSTSSEPDSIPAELTTPERHSLISEIVALCKPRVIELLITTALPAMFLAQRDFPDAIKVFGVLIGGSLAAGSANAINSILERDIDVNMNRTRHRPMASRRMSPPFAWTLAISAQVLSFLIVAFTCNIVSAAFTLLASFVYVFIYTIWLKPRSDQNIVIGGAAGALPVIIGYSAVHGTVTISAFIMFLLVFMWTPAHFWALAIFHEDDYRRGGFPMLPITRGKEKATQLIWVYTLLTVVCSLGLFFNSELRVIYMASAFVLGSWFLAEATYLVKNREHMHRGRYMRFFHVSNGYLALLFIAIAVDSIV